MVPIDERDPQKDESQCVDNGNIGIVLVQKFHASLLTLNGVQVPYSKKGPPASMTTFDSLLSSNAYLSAYARLVRVAEVMANLRFRIWDATNSIRKVGAYFQDRLSHSVSPAKGDKVDHCRIPNYVFEYLTHFGRRLKRHSF